VMFCASQCTYTCFLYICMF